MAAPPTATALRELAARSIAVIEAEQASSGAYPACSTFPVYRFAWLRDGAFVAEGLSVHNRIDGPSAFHEWAARVIVDRSERIEEIVNRLEAGATVDPAMWLPTRYNLDGTESEGGWWDFQLDGYGTWLWALQRHRTRHGLFGAPYRTAVTLLARYLSAAWSQPCYDWWEEHVEHVHVSTLTSVLAGLRAARQSGLLEESVSEDALLASKQIAATLADDGTVDGRLRKWLGSDAVDASVLAAIAPFNVFDDPVAAATVRAVEANLLDGGGVHRFSADHFYGGGRWPVLAGLLGEAYVRQGRADDARRQLEWIASTADSDGLLPEQVSDLLLAPSHLSEWVQRWGAVARPLLWSHGEYLSLAAQLGVRA